MIVVDTNLLLPFFVESEKTAKVTLVRALDGTWHLPHLWRFELANVLLRHVRLGMLSLDACRAGLRALQEELVFEEELISPAEAFECGHRTSLSGYDASYAALALRLQCPLLTWDQRVLTKLPGVAISVEEWLAGQ